MGSASSRKEEDDFEERTFRYLHGDNVVHCGGKGGALIEGFVDACPTDYGTDFCSNTNPLFVQNTESIGKLASFQDLEPPSNVRTTHKNTSLQFDNININSSSHTYSVHAEQHNEIIFGLDNDYSTPESNKLEEKREAFGIQSGQYPEHTTELYEVNMFDEKPPCFIGPIRYGKLGLQRGSIREEQEKEGIMGTVPVLEMNPDVILQELRRAGLVKQTTRGATYDIDIYVVPRPAYASRLPPLETDVIIRKLEEKEKRHHAQIEKNNGERQEKSRKLKDRHRLAKMRRSQQIKATENIELNIADVKIM